MTKLFAVLPILLATGAAIGCVDDPNDESLRVIGIEDNRGPRNSGSCEPGPELGDPAITDTPPIARTVAEPARRECNDLDEDCEIEEITDDCRDLGRRDRDEAPNVDPDM